MNSHQAGSRWLDAAVVMFALGNVTLFGVALVFKDIPDGNLPILASMGTAVLGVVTGYAVWRFKTPSAPAPIVAPADLTPPTGGSAITPPPPQTVNVVHSMGPPPASPLPPPPPMPPPTA